MTDFDLGSFTRSIAFLTLVDGEHPALELSRRYLPIANGATPPIPELMAVLEREAGGALCIGGISVRADPRTVVNLHDLRWCEQLAAVIAWAEREGRMPPQSVQPEGPWLDRQRTAARAGTLTLERRAKLDAALPGWEVTRKSGTHWDRQLAAAAAWAEREGRMPPQVIQPEGQWLNTQRVRAQKGTLSPERRAKLEAALPGWEVTDKSDAHWDRQLAAAVAWAEREDRMPPVSVQPEGKWLHNQRTAARTGTLSPERRAKLDAALPGWEPEVVDLDARWCERLASCVVWTEREGRMPPSTVNPEGRWLSAQRVAAYQGTLTPKRRAKLDAALPGWLP